MIPKRLTILSLLLFPFIAQSQLFEQSVFAGPNSSFYLSSNNEAYPFHTKSKVKYWDFGGFAGYNLEYHLPKTLSIGISLEYLLSRATLNTPCHCGYPANRTIHIENKISTHNMIIPLYFKLKTNKENYTYFTGGLGINWLFSAHRKVENVVRILNDDAPIKTEIANEQFTLANNNANQLGTFYQLGAGQIFHIKLIKFYVELSFRKDINEWVYKAKETPSGFYEYPIKRESLGLKIGVLFKNKTNEGKT